MVKSKKANIQERILKRKQLFMQLYRSHLDIAIEPSASREKVSFAMVCEKANISEDDLNLILENSELSEGVRQLKASLVGRHVLNTYMRRFEKMDELLKQALEQGNKQKVDFFEFNLMDQLGLDRKEYFKTLFDDQSVSIIVEGMSKLLSLKSLTCDRCATYEDEYNDSILNIYTAMQRIANFQPVKISLVDLDANDLDELVMSEAGTSLREIYLAPKHRSMVFSGLASLKWAMYDALVFMKYKRLTEELGNTPSLQELLGTMAAYNREIWIKVFVEAQYQS